MEYRGAVHSIRNLKNSVPEKIPAAFYEGPHKDHDITIKQSAENLKNNILL